MSAKTQVYVYRDCGHMGSCSLASLRVTSFFCTSKDAVRKLLSPLSRTLSETWFYMCRDRGCPCLRPGRPAVPRYQGAAQLPRNGLPPRVETGDPQSSEQPFQWTVKFCCTKTPNYTFTGWPPGFVELRMNRDSDSHMYGLRTCTYIVP